MVVLGDGLTFVAVFLTSIVLSRIVTTSDMATYRQVLYLGPLVVSLMEMGISGAIYRFSRVFTGEMLKAFYWEALCAMIILAFIGSICIASLAYPLAHLFNNASLKSALLITAFFPLTSMPFRLVRPLLICKGFPLKATFLEAFFAGATALSIIVPLSYGKSLNVALGAWMVVNACRLPLAGWVVSSELKGFSLHWDWKVMSQFWNYIWPLHISRFPGIAMINFDKFSTSLFLAKESFAAYSLGAREIPFLNQIASSLSSVTIPTMTEYFQNGEVHKACALWRKVCQSTAVVSYLPAAFCVWHADEIMRLLFTDVYKESAIPFAVFSSITFIRVVEYGSIAKAMGNNIVILKGACLAATIGIPFSLGMTWRWGINGICFSLLTYNIILIAYYLWQYRKQINCPITHFFPLLALVLIMGLAFSSVYVGHICIGLEHSKVAQTSTILLAFHLAVQLIIASLFYISFLHLMNKFMPKQFVEIRIPFIKR